MKMKMFLSGAVVLGLAWCIAGAALAEEAKAAAAARGPSPINPYNGMQEREEVFEFAEKPAVRVEGTGANRKWVITFASKAACDATVSIVDKDGRIIRHLASGVLGKNAPYPFQQNSLSQKIEWDGLTDDFRRVEPAGCRVKVRLGLKAKFERHFAYDPYYLPDVGQWGSKGELLAATGPDGAQYFFSVPWGQGRVFKDGKYVRTFWPPSAADLEKLVPLGQMLGTTYWGDKVPVFGWTGFTTGAGKTLIEKSSRALAMAGVSGFKEGASLPEGFPSMEASKALFEVVYANNSRLALDVAHGELYVGGGKGTVRWNENTGEFDRSWRTGWTEVAVGWDGLIYGRFGESGHGKYMIRTDRTGKMVPFTENTLKEPAPKDLHKDGFGGPPSGVVPGVLLLGNTGTGNVYQNGLHIAANGQIIAEAHWGVIAEDFSNPKALRVALADSNKAPSAWKALGVEIIGDGKPGDGQQDYFVMIWEPDGRRVTQNAVEGRGLGDGVYMDRDGNIYMVQGGVRREGQGQYGKGTIDGVKDVPIDSRRWGGAGGLFKFRGLGDKYPVGKFWSKGRIPYGGGGDTEIPPEAMKLSDRSVTGALWFYDGITGQSSNDCNCAHSRFYLDHYARSWIPAAQVCSIMLLDSSGNRMARLGRYGNVDDTEADLKVGGDGLRFVWTRSVCASDSTMYAVDYGNRRIVKAAISYAAEETALVP